MDRATVWKNLFTNWPKSLPRKGVLVTVGNEQIPYQEFFIADDVMLLQRRAPDTMGAREVMVPFTEISLLKMTEVVRPAAYREAGFQGTATD
jgi:hypothetical protein